MNITLATDEEMVRRAREAARTRGQSLNSLLRDYMKSVAGQKDREATAKEFVENARTKGGKSDPEFRFSREKAHQR